MKFAPHEVARVEAAIASALEDARARWCFDRISIVATGLEKGMRALGGGPDTGTARRVPLLMLIVLFGLLVAVSESKAVPLPPPLPGAHPVGFLDFVLTSTDATFSRWMMTARGYALGLFGPLVMMQFVLAVKGKEGIFDVLAALLDVVIRKGLWVWFLLNSETVAIGVMQGLEHVGMAIGGSNMRGSPAHFEAIGKAALVNVGSAAWDSLTSVSAKGLLAVGSVGLVFVVFLGCAWTMALTMVYVKIVAAGGLLIVGLAGLDVTTRYAWRYLEFLVRGGFKLLGVALVIGLSGTFVEYWASAANNAAFWTGDLLDLASDLLCGSFGLLLLLLLVPQMSSSMVSGGIGDTGEGKITGAMAAASQSLAMAGTAWALGKMLSSGGAGAVPGTGAAESPAQRAQKLVQAAAGGGGGGGGGEGAAGGGKPSGGGPRKPSGGGEGAGAGVSATAQSVGRTVGAMARSVQHAPAEEGEDE